MSMMNTGDILETIEMFTQDNLDVRTVTMGISLLDCIDPDPKKACENIYNKITTKAANLVSTVEHISAEYGIPIINKRISVTPIAMLLGACPEADPVDFAKTLDAAGHIAQQYPDAVCVSFQQPETSAGRLLKDFRSVAGSAYTAVRYPEDRFYLTDDGKSEPLLDALYFLPAADCASQLKLVYTAYDSGGTQLGTGELTVRVTSKQSSAVFSDVNAGTCAWAADAVDFMNGYGLIQGADASTFNWRGSMTRGDLILILYRSAGSPAVSGGSLPFTDVSESDYAYDAVVWAWKNGVAGGVSETEFCMKQAVTREQLASILYRLSGKPAVSASLRSYTDASDVSAYAVDAMRWAVGCGYLKGSGAKLNPQTGANRAEVAVLLHRYLTK